MAVARLENCDFERFDIRRWLLCLANRCVTLSQPFHDHFPFGFFHLACVIYLKLLDTNCYPTEQSDVGSPSSWYNVSKFNLPAIIIIVKRSVGTEILGRNIVVREAGRWFL